MTSSRPFARIQRHDGAAAAAELLERDALALRSSVVTTVSPTIGSPWSLSSCCCTRSVERPVGSRQDPVQRLSRAPHGSGRSSSSRRRARRTCPAGSGGSRASVRLASPRGSGRAHGWAPRISPRRTSNSATRWISLSWRAASPGRAHVCQYVVATTSATISPIADVRDPAICRFIRRPLPQRPGWRRAGAARASRSSRRSTTRRTRRTAA